MTPIDIEFLSILFLLALFIQAETKVIFTDGAIMSKTMMPALDVTENKLMIQGRQYGVLVGVDIRAADNLIFTRFGDSYGIYGHIEGLSISKAMDASDRMQVIKPKIQIDHNIIPKNNYSNVYFNAIAELSYIFSHNNKTSVLNLGKIQRINVGGSVGASIDVFYRLNMKFNMKCLLKDIS